MSWPFAEIQAEDGVVALRETGDGSVSLDLMNDEACETDDVTLSGDSIRELIQALQLWLAKREGMG